MEDNKSSNNNSEIKFDILKIDSIIKKNDTYEEGDNKFVFYSEYNPEKEFEQDQKIDFPKYVSQIKYNSFEYLGILSKNLKKEVHGYNHFDNGDEYFGQWNKDKKEGYGIYFYKEEEEPKNSEIKQIYIGEFKNNVKSGEGIYFKVKKFEEEKKDDILVPLDFNIAIGNFVDDIFTKGIVYSMDEGKRKIYKGKVNKEGKKNDENGEIYEDDNKFFCGVVEDNIMLEGRIVIMNNGEKEAGYYFNKRGNNGTEGDIEFDYNKSEKNDERYIGKLNQFNNTFDNEILKELYVNVIKIRDKCNGPDNFDYIKNLNYDIDVKQELKDQYGKYLYC
jgi:hypothetical protein